MGAGWWAPKEQTLKKYQVHYIVYLLCYVQVVVKKLSVEIHVQQILCPEYNDSTVKFNGVVTKPPAHKHPRDRLQYFPSLLGVLVYGSSHTWVFLQSWPSVEESVLSNFFPNVARTGSFKLSTFCPLPSRGDLCRLPFFLGNCLRLWWSIQCSVLPTSFTLLAGACWCCEHSRANNFYAYVYVVSRVPRLS